jgi:hypothetical protein
VTTTDVPAADGPGSPLEGDDAGPAEDYWKQRKLAAISDSHGKAVALVEEARELLGRNTADAESRARSSLRAAAETYWYAELSDRAEPEHEYLHEIGQWTRETFGCEITVQGDEYSTSCPVKLADKRLGMSIGFVARKWCSICDEDLSECSHRWWRHGIRFLPRVRSRGLCSWRGPTVSSTSHRGDKELRSRRRGKLGRRSSSAIGQICQSAHQHLNTSRRAWGRIHSRRARELRSLPIAVPRSPRSSECSPS